MYIFKINLAKAIDAVKEVLEKLEAADKKAKNK